jgi:hypothetical protein
MEGSTFTGIGTLAALAAWVAAAIGSNMIIRGDAPLPLPVLLLAALPVVAALLLLRDAASSRTSSEDSTASSLMAVSMLGLPPTFAAAYQPLTPSA